MLVLLRALRPEIDAWSAKAALVQPKPGVATLEVNVPKPRGAGGLSKELGTEVLLFDLSGAGTHPSTDIGAGRAAPAPASAVEKLDLVSR